MRMTRDDFIQKAREIHGDKYDYSHVIYTNVKTKVKIVCPLHGVFQQTPDKHLHGKCGCPKCAGNKKDTNFSFVKKARDVHGDKYDYSEVCYVNNKTPVNIICRVHGVFQQTPNNHLSGKGCPKCAGNVVLTTREFVEMAREIHGDEYSYDHVVYKNNREPVLITCSLHGDFEQIPYVHLEGSGCPVCSLLHRIEHRDSRLACQKAQLTCLQRYGVTNPMYDNDIKRKHKLIMQSDDVNNRRTQTKRDNHTFNVSLPEYRLGVLLTSIFGDEDVLHNYKSDLYPFLCDFYIRSRNIYIELNAHWSHGGHWYSENVDKQVLDKWLSGSRSYKNAANTFSVRDVAKRNVACQNSLNYIVFWKSDLSDAKHWIELGCPDGQDWIREYSWL